MFHVLIGFQNEIAFSKVILNSDQNYKAEQIRALACHILLTA